MLSIQQVNSLLTKRNVIRHLFRCEHTKFDKTLHPLKSRKILKICGPDAPTFLQGLITNDMKHLEEGAKSIYAMFLNNKGRVLYDTLIHKWEDPNCFMIECDTKVFNDVHKHLKMFRLKRKVDLNDVSEDFAVWALISPDWEQAKDYEPSPDADVNIYKDPRLQELGHRVIALKGMRGKDIAVTTGVDVDVKIDEDQYKYLRYTLGVTEGSEELLPGTTFPLEMNCDYLHGVSFHKGCYIGQEVTARTHHTGVVRKRIMPLKFTGVISDWKKDSVISNILQPKSNLGKLKGVVLDHGIGLLRIRESLDAEALSVDGNPAKLIKPDWWPKEAPKEKIGIKTETIED